MQSQRLSRHYLKIALNLEEISNIIKANRLTQNAAPHFCLFAKCLDKFTYKKRFPGLTFTGMPLSYNPLKVK